jgi:ABC-type bacteriocin/lantibiotic exporter with double-glycine peptidase domain
MATLANEEISSLENIQLSQCGINSLYLCLKHHKVEVHLEEMYSCIKPDAQNNVSLKQLADYAKNKGLYVKAIITPSVKDIQRVLNSGDSVILQYNTELPDKSDFKHIVALIKPDAKIFLLDYPKPRQEIILADLAKANIRSDGLLVLSRKFVTNWGELLDFRSPKSVSFYLIMCGTLMGITIFAMGMRKKCGKTDNA